MVEKKNAGLAAKAPRFWKVKRELVRLGKQSRALPRNFAISLFSSRYYDQFLRHKIRRHDGQVPWGRKLAIVLIFPSKGVLPSHLAMLDYLRRKDVSPLVVANLPLSDADRAILMPLVWRCLERPNVGYDFGGYRDGVLEVKEHLGALERLIFLNDSNWFPLPGAGDWLDQVEALDVDFAAAASNYAVPRPETSRFREMEWTYDEGHRNFHYCSFALCLRARAFQRRAFLQFWRGLPLHKEKNRVVRRGEIGFTQWMLKQGVTHRATLDVAGLNKDLASLDDARLAEVFRDLLIPAAPALVALRQELLASGATRAEKIAFILTVVARQGAAYTLTPFAYLEKGYPFLKKTPVKLCRESSDLTLAFARRLPADGGAEIVSEIEEWRAELDGNYVHDMPEPRVETSV